MWNNLPIKLKNCNFPQETYRALDERVKRRNFGYL